MRSTIELISDLIACESVTPDDGGSLLYLSGLLEDMGFCCELLTFGDTTNLHARFGDASPHLCFAGHVDVVPPGDLRMWNLDPFTSHVNDGLLVGRGTADMKGAIAVFIAAIRQYLTSNAKLNGSCSILLTSDEEGPGTNGIKKMVPWLKKNQQIPDVILIGEPTGSYMGEIVQIGRRGSVTAELTFIGEQGHIAYPELADNPIPRMLDCMRIFMKTPIDSGELTRDSLPSHLEVTSIDANNPVSNIIPASVTVRFGIRFNNMHDCSTIENWITDICRHHAGRHEVVINKNGEGFITNNEPWISAVENAIQEITGIAPCRATGGGTTDGRFLNVLAPVAELGFPEGTMHKVNESIFLKDIDALQAIYVRILEKYFY